MPEETSAMTGMWDVREWDESVVMTGVNQPAHTQDGDVNLDCPHGKDRDVTRAHIGQNTKRWPNIALTLAQRRGR